LTSKITVNMDSIRKLYPKPRLDSINNGADDDGSGSMGVLEIAEAIMAMPVKPKRSILFVWHTGEEAGLLGAAHFTRNPTVPIDSIVAQLNVEINRILVQPKFRSRLEEVGGIVRTLAPQELRRFMAEEHVRWGALLKNAGVNPD
jgi:hypothetical protein